MKAMVCAVALAGSVILAPVANADVSAACWAHLSDKRTHTTPAADRRYHLQRGESSPCTEYDAQDGGGNGSGSDSKRRSESQGSSDSGSYDRRSKWKDKTSFDCGWSWRGGFGC